MEFIFFKLNTPSQKIQYFPQEKQEFPHNSARKTTHLFGAPRKLQLTSLLLWGENDCDF